MKRAAMVAAALVLAAIACSHANVQDDPPDSGPADAFVPPVDVAPNATDSMPTGAISFFLSTSCPSGWSMYDDAVGRTIVPQPTDAATMVGAPLAKNEVRTHHHDATVGVDLGSTSYAGIAGAANTGVAASGHVDGSITTDDDDAGLPYVQLLPCKKTAPPSAAAVPSGMVAFFDGAACPAGWNDAPAMNGRMLVGLPTSGTPGAAFGGAPLASGETRTHSHAIAGTLALPSHGIALASGCCAGGYASAGQLTVSATSAVAAADMPYLQLRACTAP